MIRWTMQLEEKYNIAVEDDGDYIYCYNSEFYDYGRVKFHCAVINRTMDRIQIEYNHTLSDYEYGSGVVASVDGLKKFANRTISQLCNHWSLYTPEEKKQLNIFSADFSRFIMEVLYNEEV